MARQKQRTTRQAALFASTLVASVILGGLPAHAASPPEATDLIKCVPVGEETYCSDFGSMPDVDVRSLLAHVDTAIENNPDGTKDVTDNGGDLSMDELVAQLIRLSPAELKERQDSQIADARIVAAEERTEEFTGAITDSALAFAKFTVVFAPTVQCVANLLSALRQ